MRARAPDEGSVKPARWEPSFAVAPPEAPPASGETKTKGGRRKKMEKKRILFKTNSSVSLMAFCAAIAFIRPPPSIFSRSLFLFYSRSSFFLYFAEPRLNPFLAATLFSFFVGFFFHLLVLYIAYLPEWRNLKGKDIARFFFFVPLRGHS